MRFLFSGWTSVNRIIFPSPQNTPKPAILDTIVPGTVVADIAIGTCLLLIIEKHTFIINTNTNNTTAVAINALLCNPVA